MIFKMITSLLVALGLVGLVSAEEVAGRVKQINRGSGTFVLHPYRNKEGKQLPDITIKVTDKTTYKFNPPGDKTPDISAVKSGSWVRVKHDNLVAGEVVIHAKNKK